MMVKGYVEGEIELVEDGQKVDGVFEGSKGGLKLTGDATCRGLEEGTFCAESWAAKDGKNTLRAGIVKPPTRSTSMSFGSFSADAISLGALDISDANVQKEVNITYHQQKVCSDTLYMYPDLSLPCVSISLNFLLSDILITDATPSQPPVPEPPLLPSHKLHTPDHRPHP